MKENKIEAILKVAGNMFARYGFKKTSMDEIASIARVAKGTIYNYFGGKDQVYENVLQREIDNTLIQINTDVEKVINPDEKLRVFARAKFKYMRQAQNVLNLDRDIFKTFFPEVGKIRDAFFEREVEMVCNILKEGKERGFFRIDNVSLTAKAICHALKGFELKWLTQENVERIEEYLDELFNLISLGMIPENKRNE